MAQSIISPSELLRRYGLHARKEWGQNFLHDPQVHHEIVKATKATCGSHVIEIGAGLGTLTHQLLRTDAHIWAIERDRDLCQVLRQEFLGKHNFQLFEADAVKFDYGQLQRKANILPVVVGNLPYHLTGPLLFRLLDYHEVTGSWIIMVQKEVADRLCASPGSRTYGSSSIAIGRVRNVETICIVPPQAFTPAPRVYSAVIRISARKKPLGKPIDHQQFIKFVRQIFQQRRKTLLNSMGAMVGKSIASQWCQELGINSNSRPEQLPIETFVDLQWLREHDYAELPEVETVCEGLRHANLCQPVVQIWRSSSSLRVGKAWLTEQFSILEGCTPGKITRRGKYILWQFMNKSQPAKGLLVHLGMSGRFGVAQQTDVILAHTHMILTFACGRQVRLVDPRRFGGVRVDFWSTFASTEPLKDLGPEPLSSDFSGDYLYQQTLKSKRVIRDFLLDQKIVAGIGNIYANEALFLAYIHPLVPANRLRKEACEILARVIKKTLRCAIKNGGTTIKDFRNVVGEMGKNQDDLHAYGRGGELCPRCKAKLVPFVYGGRAGVFCPKEQKAPT